MKSDRDSVVDNVGGNDYHSRIPGSERRETMSIDTGLDSLLTVQDICELLRVPKSYVYYLTHNRKIPHFKINGHLRFRQSHIENWLESQEVRSSVDLPEEI